MKGCHCGRTMYRWTGRGPWLCYHCGPYEPSAFMSRAEIESIMRGLADVVAGRTKPPKPKKRWKSIGSQADLDKVAVGAKIRNNTTGEEFEIVQVGEKVNGVLQVGARPLSPALEAFAYRGGKWGFA